MSFMRIRGTNKIGLCGATVLAVVSFGGSSAFAADAQTAVAAQAPAAVATNTPAAVAAKAPDAAASDAPASDAAPRRTGPVYSYVGRASKAVMSQLTPDQVEQSTRSGVGPVGIVIRQSVLGALAGKDDVDVDDADPVIQDTSEDLARAIASGLANAKGGVLANGPIVRDQWRGPEKEDAVREIGVRYVVEVTPVTMQLLYFSLDWRHYDLTFNTTAQVIDTVDGHVVSKAKCWVGTDHSEPLLRRHELLENHAEKLLARVTVKTSTCLAKLEASLKLPASNGRLLTAAVLASDPAMPFGSAPRALGAEIISGASTTCDADKQRYAAEIGVPCESLSNRVNFNPGPAQSASNALQAPSNPQQTAHDQQKVASNPLPPAINPQQTDSNSSPIDDLPQPTAAEQQRTASK
jgi:hypothetical protein